MAHFIQSNPGRGPPRRKTLEIYGMSAPRKYTSRPPSRTQAIKTLTAYSFLTKHENEQIFDMHPLVHLATRNWLKIQEQLTPQKKTALSTVSEALSRRSHKEHSIRSEYLPHAIYVAATTKELVENEARESLFHTIGRCQQSLGRYKAAEITHRQVLELRMGRLGEENSSTLRSMNEVAIALRYQGKYAEAEKIYRKQLVLREKVSGKEHPQTLFTRNNLALVLFDQGNHAEAEFMHREILALSEKVLGKEHPETLITRSNLGIALHTHGKYAEAELIYREILALREEVLGREHPDTLKIRDSLGAVLGDQGKLGGAELMHRETLALKDEILGKKPL